MNTNKKILAKGTEAIGMAAINAGCKYYFGYPITPQNEIPEYLSAHLPAVGGKFLQAESEVASVNMLLGAAATGVRVMTSSSSPGISLMQEGISYLSGSELPAVIVNMTRTGPGLGGINATQGDYFQSVKGGGHGDYKCIVLAPHSVQELYNLTFRAFNLADKYRMVSIILADAILGQIKEPINTEPPEPIIAYDKSWALTGAVKRDGKKVKSLYLGDGEMEQHIRHLWDKYKKLAEEDTMFELDTGDKPVFNLNVEQLDKIDDFKESDMLVIAFGSCARILKTAIYKARENGKKITLLRPITLYPFPEKQINKITEHIKNVFVFETNMGQMVEDVRLSVSEGSKVHLYARPGGTVVNPDEVYNEMMKYV
jgi:2-oxoglutarate ferredoxin oxidoreductase subunit alpha